MQSIQMNHKQQGFTLIELMIVVAIIGILAAIAIPQYQDYIARSQMNRAYGEISALKTAAEESLMRGQEPSDLASIGYTGSSILTGSGTTGGTGTEVDFSSGDGSGTIQGQLGGDASTAISDVQVVLTRTTEGSWNCSITNYGSAGGWDSSFVPTGCSES